MKSDIREIAERTINSAHNKVANIHDSEAKVAIYTNADDRGSQIYLKLIIKELEGIGIHNMMIFPQSSFASVEEFNKSIDAVAANETVCAVIIQRPIISSLYAAEMAHLTEVARSEEYGWKFVDKKFDEVNLADELDYPCTAVALMQAIRIVFPDPDARARKFGVIFNRSQNVGIPTSQLMIGSRITTTVCNSKTPWTMRHQLMEMSDIIITATGVKDLFTYSDLSSMLPKSDNRKLIIDVGTPGDISAELGEKLSLPELPYVYYLPAKGGIGLLTKAILIDRIANNYVKNFYRRSV